MLFYCVVNSVDERVSVFLDCDNLCQFLVDLRCGSVIVVYLKVLQ
jgi:hypothetical protein